MIVRLVYPRNTIIYVRTHCLLIFLITVDYLLYLWASVSVVLIQFLHILLLFFFPQLSILINLFLSSWIYSTIVLCSKLFLKPYSTLCSKFFLQLLFLFFFYARSPRWLHYNFLDILYNTIYWLSGPIAVSESFAFKSINDLDFVTWKQRLLQLHNFVSLARCYR